MGLQEQGIVFGLTAQIDEDTALVGDPGRKAQGFKGFLYPCGGPVGETGGGIYGEYGLSLLPGIIRIRNINHIVLLKSGNAILRQLPA